MNTQTSWLPLMHINYIHAEAINLQFTERPLTLQKLPYLMHGSSLHTQLALIVCYGYTARNILLQCSAMNMHFTANM